MKDYEARKQMPTKVLSARGLAYAWPVPAGTMRSCATREMWYARLCYSSWRTLRPCSKVAGTAMRHSLCCSSLRYT